MSMRRVMPPRLVAEEAVERAREQGRQEGHAQAVTEIAAWFQCRAEKIRTIAETNREPFRRSVLREAERCEEEARAIEHGAYRKDDGS